MDNESPDLRSVIDEAINVISKFVVPIYTDIKGKPFQFGTGFFLKFSDCVLFVSAAHVLKVATVQDIYIYTSSQKIMKLAGKLILSPGEGGPSDKVDIGVMRLREDMTVPPYMEIDKHVVLPNRLIPDYKPRKGCYGVIAGFPASKSKLNPVGKSIGVTSYSYHTYFLEEAEYEQYGLDEGYHVAMHLDLKVGFGSNGKHRNFPKPEGMSGSPIWVLYDDKEEVEYFPLVAIGIEYRLKEKLLVGTDVSVVYDLARKIT